MDKKDIYYHITKKEYIENILKEGLKPKIGENSKAVKETTPAIYLCKENDLPYWSILLDSCVILQINIDEKELTKFSYCIYDEYICYCHIDPEYLQQVEIFKPKPEHMKKLCLSYLGLFSKFTEYCAKYYNEDQNDEKINILENLAKSLIVAMYRLNYSILTKEEIQKELIEAGESGEYTFCDTYNNTERKLYEQLLYYPKDKLTQKRKEIYDYIITTFSDCLYINTGGWCIY